MRSGLMCGALFLFLAGCSSSMEANVAEFKATAQSISSAVARHRTAAAEATTVEACQAELTRYGDELRPGASR